MQSHLCNIYRYKVSGEFQFEIILFVNTMSDHGHCPAQDTILTVEHSTAGRKLMTMLPLVTDDCLTIGAVAKIFICKKQTRQIVGFTDHQ